MDHAGATPIDRKILREMIFCEKEFFANPSAIYSDGLKIRDVIEQAREKIAKLINAHANEIIFTGSGTESNGLAILGIITNYELQITNKKLEYVIPHIVTTTIEHPAVLENCRWLAERGQAEVTYVDVDKHGIVKLDDLEKSLKENTVLVSVMYANNEIGTTQPIEEIAKIIRHFKKKKREEQIYNSNNDYPFFHTDACQAMNYLFTKNIEKLGVDMLTFNSSKIYGPKGIGVLYKKRNIVIFPLYKGGGQEFGLRSGTESVALISGLSQALSIVEKLKEKEIKRLTKIRDYGIEKLLSLSLTSGFKIILNGHKEKRLPNNINISVLGISSELLVLELSSRGIYISEKSACKSNDNSKSYVIGAIRKICPKDGKEIEGSLRISLGRSNKKSDIDLLYKELKRILEKYRQWK